MQRETYQIRPADWTLRTFIKKTRIRMLKMVTFRDAKPMFTDWTTVCLKSSSCLVCMDKNPFSAGRNITQS